MFGINYTAMQINYLQNELKKLPQGSFGTIRGQKVVYITCSPDEDGNVSTTQSRFRLSSRKGRLYADDVQKSLDIKKEIRRLEEKIYPRKIEIAHEYKSQSYFNNQYYDACSEYMNTFPYSSKYENNGHILRSKNEVIATQVFEQLGIPFKVETILKFKNGDVIFPDMLLNFRAADRCVFFEICGLFEQDNYVSKNALKLQTYLSHGLEYDKDLICLFCTSNKSVDANVIRNAVIAVAENICPAADCHEAEYDQMARI